MRTATARRRAIPNEGRPCVGVRWHTSIGSRYARVFTPTRPGGVQRPARSVGTHAALAGLVAGAAEPARAAVVVVGLAVDAGAGRAFVQAWLALALLVHTVFARAVAGSFTRPTVDRVARDVLAATAAIQRAEGALAAPARALRAVRTDGRAVATVLFVIMGVEASVRTSQIELSVEQVRVADALSVLAQRVHAALGVTAPAPVFVPLDVDAAIAAIERAGPALTGALDATAGTAPEAVAASVAEKPTA